MVVIRKGDKMMGRVEIETMLAYEFIRQGIWDEEDLFLWNSNEKVGLSKIIWNTATNIERTRGMTNLMTEEWVTERVPYEIKIAMTELIYKRGLEWKEEQL
jgi:hypothetical protein